MSPTIKEVFQVLLAVVIPLAAFTTGLRSPKLGQGEEHLWRHPRQLLRDLLAILILVALALLAIPVLRGLRRPRMPAAPEKPQVTAPVPAAPAPAVRPPVEATPPAPAPAAPEAAAPAPAAAEPGTIEDMAAYLSGTGETTPHAFSPSPLTFAFGSAVPTPESTKTLDEIGTLLKAHPSATIRVESHTDAIGNQEANLNLSQARAESIKNELVDRGVDGARIETAGMGQDLPAASNDTAEGRASNRRSEIVVTSR